MKSKGTSSHWNQDETAKHSTLVEDRGCLNLEENLNDHLTIGARGLKRSSERMYQLKGKEITSVEEGPQSLEELTITSV